MALFAPVFFFFPGRELRKKGINRIGNLLVPNNNYCLFEDWVMPILDAMLEEQRTKVLCNVAPSSEELWVRKEI